MRSMTTASNDVISVVNQITSRLMTLPVNDLYEVARFIDALEFSSSSTVSEAMTCALASEPTLAKYWDNPEEDAAWADLLEATPQFTHMRRWRDHGQGGTIKPRQDGRNPKTYHRHTE